MRLKPERLVRCMGEVAEQLGVQVRWEQGRFKGGQCIVNGNPVVILNRRHPTDIHLDILAEVLRDLPLDTVYMRPAVREDINALIVKP